MLQRPRFNSYSAGCRSSPSAENQVFSNHRYLIKKQYKSHDLLNETLDLPTLCTINPDQFAGNIALGRKTSKIRRLSSLLNKKFNRNRLSREKISPPVLITSSSFIDAVPIEKPAKELSSVENQILTSHASKHPNGTNLPTQLSRQSSKSSTHTLQRQLSEREIIRLGSRNLTKHYRFLSGSSLSSFTSDGSSDKHSSFGTYNREHIIWPSYITPKNEVETDNTYSSFPILSDSFNQQTTDWERAALAETAIIESALDSNDSEDYRHNVSLEETSLVWDKVARSNPLPTWDDRQRLYRFSGSDIIDNSKWDNVNVKERAKSACITRIETVLSPSRNKARDSPINPAKAKWREAVIYAKNSEDYEYVFSEFGASEHTSTKLSEASIPKYLDSLSPSSSEDSFVNTATNLSQNPVGVNEISKSFEIGNHHEVNTESLPPSCFSTSDIDTYRHSIFDLYCYNSSEDEAGVEPVAECNSEIGDLYEYSACDTTVANIIHEVDDM